MLQKPTRAICSTSAAMLATFSLIFASTPAAAQDFTGKQITSVQIKYRGAKNVDEARIRNMMAVKSGQLFSPEKLDDDIRTLVDSGLIDDVSMSGEARGGGMALIVEVITRPALGGVGFAGNSYISSTKLAKETKLKPGTPLSDAAIFEARKNIEKYYQGYGYPDVTINHRIQPTDRQGYSDLIFDIQEGGKNIVRKIRFQGNNSIPTHKLRNEMKTKEKGILSFLTKSGKIDLEKLSADEELVLDYYRNQGFLRVSSPGFQRVPVKNGRVDLVMPIHEGTKYSINQISFGKMTVFNTGELAPSLTLNAGDAFSSEKMRDDIRTIRSYYGSRGYADAAVEPDIRDAGPGKVNVTYRVHEGRRYKVGRVTIEGNNKTQDKVIRREIPLKPNDNFNTVDLETTKKRLQNLNYFNTVVAEGEPSAQAGYRDINILVDEKNTGSISFGVGFSSIDNVVGYINLEETNFDITNPWSFKGGGQRFGVNLRLGAERRDFRISLVEPWFLGRRLELGGDLFYRDQLYLSDEYDQRNIGGSIFMRKPLGKHAYLRGEYRLEQIRISLDDDLQAGSAFEQFGGDFLKSSVGVHYVYDNRDSLTTARKGHKLDVGVESAGSYLGGDTDTYTFSIQGSKHWNLWWDSILNLRGAVTAVESDGDTPIFDRQMLGGAHTLRGFEFRDVGPRDTGFTNEVYGGNTSAFITAEWTFPIVETVRGALFYDTGFVNEDSFDFSPSDLYSDAGFGLRLNLPFGPLALDYAIPLSSPDEEADNGGQFNFYLNYQF